MYSRSQQFFILHLPSRHGRLHGHFREDALAQSLNVYALLRASLVRSASKGVLVDGHGGRAGPHLILRRVFRLALIGHVLQPTLELLHVVLSIVLD